MTAPAPEFILQRLDAIARQHLKRTDALRLEDSLSHQVATDSLLRMTLLVETENAFQICIEDEEAMALTTVGDLVALVASKRDARAG